MVVLVAVLMMLLLDRDHTLVRQLQLVKHKSSVNMYDDPTHR